MSAHLPTSDASTAGRYNQVTEDLIEAELRAEEHANSLQQEITALRDRLGDPVKIEVYLYLHTNSF